MDAIDIAYAGAARQAELIADGEVSSREVVEATLARIEARRPAPERLSRRLRRARAARGRPGRRAPQGQGDAPAARRAGRHQGRGQHGRRDHRVGDGRARRRQARGRRVRPPPARGGGDPHRQDERARDDDLAVHRDPDVGRHPQPVEPRPHARRVERRHRRRGGGGPRRRRPRLRRRWARSASRPPGPACSGIKPTRDRVPLGDHVDAWQGLSVIGPLARHVADAALFLDATADDPPEGGFLAASRTPPGPLQDRRPPQAACPGPSPHRGRRRASACSTRRPMRCARSATRSSTATSSCRSGPVRTAVARYLRGIADDVARRCRIPSASSAARAAWRGWAA